MNAKLGAITEQGRSRITSAEMKNMRKTAKYMWQEYKTNEDMSSEPKINPVVKQIQNYINKWIQHVWQMDRGRLPHLIRKYQPCGKRSQGRPLKRLLDC
jgi:hypothetical protein